MWVSRRIRTEEHYLVAGRSLGYGLTTFSVFATWFGAETIVGAAGSAYRDGLTPASAEPFGYGLCLILMGALFAVPLWRRRLTTLADLFAQRYSAGVARFAAIILIPSSVLWAAAQVRAFGQVLATTSPGLDVSTAVGLAAGFVVAYAVFGGLLADAITDVVQGGVLVVGLVVLGVAVVVHLGGPEASVEAVRAGGGLRLTSDPSASWLVTLEAWAIPVLGSVVAAELVARVIAARSPTVARRSVLMGGGLYLAIGLVPVFIGLAAPVLVPALGLTLSDAEQLVPSVAQALLPTVLHALFIGGLISAILSTVDSTLLVASGLLSHNVIVPMLGAPSERTKVRIARAGVAGFGLVAYLLAMGAEGVFALVEEASAFGSAGAVVTICFALFTSWGGPRTAYATLALGLLAYVGGGVAALPYPFLLSIAVALATYVLGALIETPTERARTPMQPASGP